MNSKTIIQITDTHILQDREQEFSGFNTTKSLEAVIKEINDEDAELVLITGDLVQDPDEASYKNFLSITSKINKPCYCLPGNHDNPELMRTLFDNSHMQFIDFISFDNWKLIFLNSYKPNTHAGYLSDKELEKLKLALDVSEEKSILIALHHHAVQIDSPWMDGMMLENADELNKILNRYNNVRVVINGHIHQEFEFEKDNIKYLGSPSTCVQFKPKAIEYQQDDLSPAYRKLNLSDNGVNSEVVYINYTTLSRK